LLKGLLRRAGNVLRGRPTLDEDTREELAAALIQADVSVTVALEMVEELRDEAEAGRVSEPEELLALLREQVFERLQPYQAPLNTGEKAPTTMLVLGVNGVGKTTTIAKIAYWYKSAGNKVLLVAGDTFRAAGIEQLQEWGNRVGCEVIAQAMGADPAAVMYDGMQAALARGVNLVIADTAGRLHTKVNLMEELAKMDRVIERAIGRPSDERLLVIDANTGQNAINQAREFNEAIGVTGIIIAKLDSTAKGGTLLTLTHELEIPIKLVGIGERLEDVVVFSAREFADGIV
jgi:fused signal recognition particle receptor